MAAAVASVTASNAASARVAVAVGETGCTDVTGFGLLGHLMKMAAASHVDAVLDVGAVPFLAGARELAADGTMPGGSRLNRDWVASAVDTGRFTKLDVLLLADAQTSGGLLFGVAPERASYFVAELGHPAEVVGSVRAGGAGSRCAEDQSQLGGPIEVEGSVWVSGDPHGLQNRCGRVSRPGGFDSRPLPLREARRDLWAQHEGGKLGGLVVGETETG